MSLEWDHSLVVQEQVVIKILTVRAISIFITTISHSIKIENSLSQIFSY